DLAGTGAPSEPVRGGVRSRAAGFLVGEGDERLPERPSTPASPRLIVESKAASERLSALTGEEGPGHHEIAGRVANGSAPEVDYGSQVPLGDEHIRGPDIAVDPHRRPVPRADE